MDKDAKNWFRKGNSYFNKRNFQKAVECYEKALELNPDFVNAWIKKADSLNFLHKPQESLVCLDNALELDPNNVSAMIIKSYTFFRPEQAQEAVNLLNQALKIDPDNSSVFAAKGHFLTRIGEYQEASICFDKALKLDPNQLYGWIYKAELFGKLLSYEKALEFSKRALELLPNDAQALNGVGWYLILLGKIKEGMEYLDKALIIEPTNSHVWDSKGYALYKLGRYEDAIQCFDKVIGFAAGHTDAEEHREQAYEKLHNKDPEISLRQDIHEEYKQLIEYPPRDETIIKAYAGQDPYIFISYSHKDSTYVHSQIEWMHERGFNIWYDEGIPLGSHWVEEIVRALENCSFFIVFITENSMKSKMVNKEVVTAIEKSKYVLPVHMEPTNIRKDWQFMFADLQQINFFDVSEQHFRNKVVEVIKEKLS